MNEIVTPELKAKIHELFERHDKIVEEQDEYIELLRAEVKQLRGENRQIDKNAASVQKEYKKEIERLQSAYLRAVTERDKAVEDLKMCEHINGSCYYCKWNINNRCKEPKPWELCHSRNKWEWRGLERSVKQNDGY